MSRILYRLRRHPIPMRATFRHSLVLAYAFPREVLQPLLPPGLTVDAYGDLGFAAVAMVQTEAMRPAGLPRAFGRPYFLVGYRIFCRFRTAEGRLLRGLHILRSDADAWTMVTVGNALTHYGYRLAETRFRASDERLDIEVRTRDGGGDLSLSADLSASACLPPESPFASDRDVRRFAGPLPFTFDYESETGSIVVIEGVRKVWNPRPVMVDVRKASFFGSSRFDGATPVLASAFHVADVDYLWRRGVVRPLGLARIEAAA
jgi:hypothetical protein